MNRVADNPFIVPDRELGEERKPGRSEPPRIRCPLCDWSPGKEDEWFCTCGHQWNTFDTGGVCPGSGPVERFNAVAFEKSRAILSGWSVGEHGTRETYLTLAPTADRIVCG